MPGSDATTVATTVTGLTNGVSYTFGVRAVNQIGTSPVLNEVSVTPVGSTPDSPSGLAAVSGDTQVTLRWTDPDDSSLTHYQYQHKKADGPYSRWVDAPDSDATTTTHTVTGLTNRVSYTFGVRAVDENAAGGGSDPATATPTDLSPGRPNGLETETGDTQVTLRWNNPHDSSLTHYQYQHKKTDGPYSRWADAPDSDATTVAATVTGLTNGVSYTFGVRAVDTSGASDPAQASAEPLPRLALQPTGLNAVVNNAQVTINWDEPAIDSPPITKYQLLGLFETQQLTPKDGVTYDRFGYSVAVDGNIAVIGAPGNSAGAGAVYLYTKGSSGRWRQTTKLVATDRQAGDNFGISVAIDHDTDTVVVGAYADDHPNNKADSGSVYVYTKNPKGAWVEDTKLVAADGAERDWFGYSVAVHNNTVLIGTPQDNNNKDDNNDDGDDDGDDGVVDDVGSVYVFTKDPVDGWRQTAKLVASDGAEGDSLGFSVAVDQNTAVIGAPGTDHTSRGADSGSVYVFTKDPDDVWRQTAKLVASDGAEGDSLGFSVAVNQNTAVIGAPGTDHTSRGADSGSVYVFTKNPNDAWNEQTKLTNPNGAEGDNFGHSVAVNQNTAVTGAPGTDHTSRGADSGSVYVFTKNPNDAWNEQTKLTNPNGAEGDSLGHSVAVDQNTAVTGAPGTNHNNNSNADTGSFYVTDIRDWTDIPGSDTTTTSHTAADLTNNGQYTLQIRAANLAGESPPSSSVTATVITLTTVQTGPGRVRLVWDAGANPPAVTGYQFTQDSGATWTEIPGSDHTTVSHTVSGLTNNTDITFAVRAVTNPGDGFSSDFQTVTILPPPAAPTGLVATADQTQITLDWDNPHNSTITGYQLLQKSETKLTASDHTADTLFGRSLAMDGDTIVIGAPLDDSNSINSGSAYLYTKQTSGEWRQTAKLTASDGAADDYFGHTVAIDGDTIAVGVYRDNEETGSVYIYTKPPTGWTTTTQTAKLTASDTAAGDRFGISVAIDDDTIIVGAYLNSHTTAYSGSAYVYTKDSTGGWRQTAKLTASDGESGDYFGYSVAVDGDTIIIGAGLDDDNPTKPDSGSAYLYTKPPTGWTTTTQTAKLTASDRAAGDGFGISVTINGDTVIVGAALDDDNPTKPDSGSAYLYTKPPTGWTTTTQTAKLTASDRAAGDGFGISVTTNGDTAVIGAHGDETGSAYVYTKPAAGWTTNTQTAKLTASDRAAGDGFGISVTTNGDTAVIGAYGDDHRGDESGSAYIMGIPKWTNIWESNTTTTSHTITGLTNNTKYTFRIRAINTTGPSPASDTTTTPLAKPN